MCKIFLNFLILNEVHLSKNKIEPKLDFPGKIKPILPLKLTIFRILSMKILKISDVIFIFVIKNRKNLRKKKLCLK